MTMSDDKRIEFHELLKHGRDTRPEQVWVHIGQYYVEKLGYNETVEVRPFFGIFMARMLGWPDPKDLHLDSDIVEVYIKGWVKYNLHNLPEPYSEKYTMLRNDMVRCMAVGELVYETRGVEAFWSSIRDVEE